MSSTQNNYKMETVLLATIGVCGAISIGILAYQRYNSRKPATLIDAFNEGVVSKKFLTEAATLADKYEFPLGVNNENLLCLACRNGLLPVVEELLPRYKSQLQATNIFGCNILHVCVIKGDHVDVLRRVVAYIQEIGGISLLQTLLDQKTYDNQWTPFHICAATGRTESILYLLTLQERVTLPINEQDAEGHTPLMMASCNGFEVIAKALLLEPSCDLNLLNSKLKSCLYFAAHNGNLAMTKLILDEERKRLEGKNSHLVNVCDFYAKSPLFVACTNGNIEVVRLLIANGADIAKKSVSGETILNVLCQRISDNYYRILVELCEQPEIEQIIGDLLDAKNSFGCNALHDACYVGNHRVLRTLAHKREKLFLQSLLSADNDGLTPVHSLCRGFVSYQKRKDILLDNLTTTLKLLLELGVELNNGDYSNAGCLHFLCYNPPDDPALVGILSSLLNYGVNPTLEDTFGWSPLHALYQTSNESNKTSRQMIALIETHMKTNYPDYYQSFDPTKPRNTQDRTFVDRSGPHNQIPLEKRKAVLNGNCTLQGIAEFIQRFPADRKMKVVVLAGAGISVNCGIPDFRSPKSGIYATMGADQFSLPALMNDPAQFYSFVQEIFGPVMSGKIQPTYTHYFLRLLEEKGLLLRIYTQNIDTLEFRAGIPAEKIIEAHGSFASARCVNCGKAVDDMKNFWQTVGSYQVPTCDSCNNLIRPDVVFFGESPPNRFFQHHHEDLKEADLLIVMGTSLVVYPFASLLNMVDLLTPRLLINKELVGPFAKIASEVNYRDTAFVGDCDEGVKALAGLLGWTEDLEVLKQTNNK